MGVFAFTWGLFPGGVGRSDVEIAISVKSTVTNAEMFDDGDYDERKAEQRVEQSHVTRKKLVVIVIVVCQQRSRTAP